MKFTATVSAEYSLLMFAFSYNITSVMSAATETMTNGRPRDLNPMRLKWYSTYSRRRTPHAFGYIVFIAVNKQLNPSTQMESKRRFNESTLFGRVDRSSNKSYNILDTWHVVFEVYAATYARKYTEFYVYKYRASAPGKVNKIVIGEIRFNVL